MFAVTSTTLV